MNKYMQWRGAQIRHCAIVSVGSDIEHFGFEEYGKSQLGLTVLIYRGI